MNTTPTTTPTTVHAGGHIAGRGSALGTQLAALSEWIDSAPTNAGRDPEARMWGRVAKISEEAGEAIAALIGVTGQNPRKGVTHTIGDLRAELLDVAVCALVAVEHLDLNHGTSTEALAAHVAGLIERAGLNAPAEREAEELRDYADAADSGDNADVAALFGSATAGYSQALTEQAAARDALPGLPPAVAERAAELERDRGRPITLPELRYLQRLTQAGHEQEVQA